LIKKKGRYHRPEKIKEIYINYRKEIEKLEHKHKDLNSIIEHVIEIGLDLITEINYKKIKKSSSSSSSGIEIGKEKEKEIRKLKIIPQNDVIEKYISEKSLSTILKLEMEGNETTFRTVIEFISKKWHLKIESKSIVLIDAESDRKWGVKKESSVFENLEPVKRKNNKFYYQLYYSIKDLKVKDDENTRQKARILIQNFLHPLKNTTDYSEIVKIIRKQFEDIKVIIEDAFNICVDSIHGQGLSIVIEIIEELDKFNDKKHRKHPEVIIKRLIKHLEDLLYLLDIEERPHVHKERRQVSFKNLIEVIAVDRIGHDLLRHKSVKESKLTIEVGYDIDIELLLEYIKNKLSIVPDQRIEFYSSEDKSSKVHRKGHHISSALKLRIEERGIKIYTLFIGTYDERKAYNESNPSFEDFMFKRIQVDASETERLEDFTSFFSQYLGDEEYVDDLESEIIRIEQLQAILEVEKRKLAFKLESKVRSLRR